MAQNLPRGTPARVLVLLTMLTGLVMVSAWRDALRRDRDVWISYPTALGDSGLLLPNQLPVVLESGGDRFSLNSGGPVLHRRDDHMFRVLTGPGAQLPFSLFTTRESMGEESDPKLYARPAPHQYLRLRTKPQPPQTALPALERPDRSSPEPTPPKAIPVGPDEAEFPGNPPANPTL